MAAAGLCCASLEDQKTLMKMGLSLVLLGHVNFLLGALVYGIVLRHINLHKQARAMEYAISNVVALASGLVGIVVGILVIVLSKNKKSRGLTWSVFAIALGSALMAAASAVGLFVSVVRTIVHGGRSLLTHCRFPDAIGYSSVTNECPFDPTRIYSTTLILWVPLIVTCIIQMVFSARCVSLCVSFLGLSGCRKRKTSRDYGRAINVVRPLEEAPPPRYAKPPSSYVAPSSSSFEPPTRYTEAPRSHREPLTRNTEPPRQHHRPPPPQHHRPPPTQHHRPPPPQHHRPPPPQHRSLPPSERRPLRPPSRDRRSGRDAADGRQQSAPEEHRLLERGSLDRSSFWI